MQISTKKPAPLAENEGIVKKMLQEGSRTSSGSLAVPL